jgi:hypothetical protein
VIFAVFHAVKAMVRRHLLESLAKEGDVLLALHEAHVWTRFEKGSWTGNGALRDEV